jgi:large subunit ribosomal protein L29
MKIQELRQMTTVKLVELLKKTRREASTTRFRLATGQNQNSAELKNMRTQIAQIKTLLHEQKLADITKK